jgi:hypothetical protein
MNIGRYQIISWWPHWYGFKTPPYYRGALCGVYQWRMSIGFLEVRRFK